MADDQQTGTRPHASAELADWPLEPGESVTAVIAAAQAVESEAQELERETRRHALLASYLDFRLTVQRLKALCHALQKSADIDDAQRRRLGEVAPLIDAVAAKIDDSSPPRAETRLSRD